VTLAVTVVSALELDYRSAGATVAIETTATLVALVVATILIGRFQRRHGRGDLLLAAALTLLAATNLLFSTLPALDQELPGPFEVWAPLAGSAAAASLLLAAAFLPPRPVLRPARALIRAALLVLAVLVVIAVVVASLGSALPVNLDETLSPLGRSRVIGPTPLLAANLALAVIYAASAVGFTRRAEQTGDDFTTWLAAACTVASFARLNYFLFPSGVTEWVYTGDILRLAFYLTLLTGGLRAIAASQREAAAVAAEAARRRLARDLHDGIAQHLAFIASQSHRLKEAHRPDVAALVGDAANRALDESRAAIGVLSRQSDETLGEALAATVGDLAGRSSARVDIDVDDSVTVNPEVQETLLRIAGEAVNNSLRHGDASTICVSLEYDDGLALRISDDGAGFDTGNGRRGGFGLDSMRARAREVGAALSIESAPGRGTSVEVRVR